MSGVDDEEAELRKEHLRLQNAALAQQLMEQARRADEARANRELASDVARIGLKAGKLALIIGALILFGLLFLFCGAIAYDECKRDPVQHSR